MCSTTDRREFAGRLRTYCPPSSWGAASQLVQYGFEVLTEAGYKPGIADLEVRHELKLVADLMWEGSIAKQCWSISNTAEYGDYVTGPRAIAPKLRELRAEGSPTRSGPPALALLRLRGGGAAHA